MLWGSGRILPCAIIQCWFVWCIMCYAYVWGSDGCVQIYSFRFTHHLSYPFSLPRAHNRVYTYTVYTHIHYVYLCSRTYAYTHTWYAYYTNVRTCTHTHMYVMYLCIYVCVYMCLSLYTFTHICSQCNLIRVVHTLIGRYAWHSRPHTQHRSTVVVREPT